MNVDVVDRRHPRTVMAAAEALVNKAKFELAFQPGDIAGGASQRAEDGLRAAQGLYRSSASGGPVVQQLGANIAALDAKQTDFNFHKLNRPPSAPFAKRMEFVASIVQHESSEQTAKRRRFLEHAPHATRIISAVLEYRVLLQQVGVVIGYNLFHRRQGGDVTDSDLSRPHSIVKMLEKPYSQRGDLPNRPVDFPNLQHRWLDSWRRVKRVVVVADKSDSLEDGGRPSSASASSSSSSSTPAGPANVEVCASPNAVFAELAQEFDDFVHMHGNSNVWLDAGPIWRVGLNPFKQSRQHLELIPLVRSLRSDTFSSSLNDDLVIMYDVVAESINLQIRCTLNKIAPEVVFPVLWDLVLQEHVLSTDTHDGGGCDQDPTFKELKGSEFNAVTFWRCCASQYALRHASDVCVLLRFYHRAYGGNDATPEQVRQRNAAIYLFFELRLLSFWMYELHLSRDEQFDMDARLPGTSADVWLTPIPNTTVDTVIVQKCYGPPCQWEDAEMSNPQDASKARDEFKKDQIALDALGQQLKAAFSESTPIGTGWRGESNIKDEDTLKEDFLKQPRLTLPEIGVLPFFRYHPEMIEDALRYRQEEYDRKIRQDMLRCMSERARSPWSFLGKPKPTLDFDVLRGKPATEAKRALSCEQPSLYAGCPNPSNQFPFVPALLDLVATYKEGQPFKMSLMNDQTSAVPAKTVKNRQKTHQKKQKSADSVNTTPRDSVNSCTSPPSAAAAASFEASSVVALVAADVVPSDQASSANANAPPQGSQSVDDDQDADDVNANEPENKRHCRRADVLDIFADGKVKHPIKRRKARPSPPGNRTELESDGKHSGSSDEDSDVDSHATCSEEEKETPNLSVAMPQVTSRTSSTSSVSVRETAQDPSSASSVGAAVATVASADKRNGKKSTNKTKTKGSSALAASSAAARAMSREDSEQRAVAEVSDAAEEDDSPSEAIVKVETVEGVRVSMSYVNSIVVHQTQYVSSDKVLKAANKAVFTIPYKHVSFTFLRDNLKQFPKDHPFKDIFRLVAAVEGTLRIPDEIMKLVYSLHTHNASEQEAASWFVHVVAGVLFALKRMAQLCATPDKTDWPKQMKGFKLDEKASVQVVQLQKFIAASARGRMVTDVCTDEFCRFVSHRMLNAQLNGHLASLFGLDPSIKFTVGDSAWTIVSYLLNRANGKVNPAPNDEITDKFSCAASVALSVGCKSLPLPARTFAIGMHHLLGALIIPTLTMAARFQTAAKQ